ncbi:sensor histidine kinase [Cellulomonas sp. PhB150]|uniref:sensor histidine kinase n=1 Tax=Cellulomonas sp. PhB150 TaxID=2485188 RepID=UPI000F4608EF|nr:sensor histidine kinase [Cellulomonas sp. PhB150]ROS23592.1 signal transduction histidine kinase [Cellulomonas sp. PhB150]
MTTAPTPELRRVAPAVHDVRAFLAAPWSGATWRAVSQLVIGGVVMIVAATLVVALVSVDLSILLVFGLGIPTTVATLLAARPFARWERARLELQLGAQIDAPAYRVAERPGWWASWVAVLGDGRSWAHLAYPLVAGLVLCGSVVAGALGSVGLAALAYPAVASWQGVDLTSARLALAVGGGLVLLWAGAVLLQLLAAAQVRVGRALLGPSARQATADATLRAAVAEQRAEHLATTRTAAVGAADEERRRIERDLHDGAQQRLVALGVELGAARRNAASDPQAAAAALEHAHREVKETLAELRDLVRGIHPAVLTDRGLDAALSALAARSPVPVEVVVDDPPAVDATSGSAQAAAYFVVAEALTNAAKHASAQQVVVRADVVGDRLRVVIADDGVGGAAAGPGSGLEGLASRVAALDGTFDLDSPAGAGTRVTVEVPCAS